MRRVTTYLVIALLGSSCRQQPEVAVLQQAGLAITDVDCRRPPETSLTFCRHVLHPDGTAQLTTGLALTPLDTSTAQFLAVWTERELPEHCSAALRTALESDSDVRGVFDQPSTLFEAGNAVQFQYMILVPADPPRESCILFDLAYG